MKMCRLRWTGDMESWELAFHKYSDEQYEPSIHFDGSGIGSPEACLTAPHRFTFGSGGPHGDNYWVRINWQVH